MYPNAGDVQAPAQAATPGSGRKSHVYREEWEMDEGAYGSKGTPRLNSYSELWISFFLSFFLFVGGVITWVFFSFDCFFFPPVFWRIWQTSRGYSPCHLAW